MERLLGRGSRLLDDDAGEVFLIGVCSVTGNFTGAEYSEELTTKGGIQEHVRGTLFVSRARYPDLALELMTIITGPGSVKYRMAKILPDATGWTIHLTEPNARTKG